MMTRDPVQATRKPQDQDQPLSQEKLLPGMLVFPKPAQPAQPPAFRWHAVPGGAIELGDTGFAIRLNGGPPTPQRPNRYTLVNPEGQIDGFGPDLARLKAWGEQLAAERAEFVWLPDKATP